MADSKDISFEEKLNEVLQARAKTLSEVNKLMSEQSRLCSELSKLCGTVPNYKPSVETLEEMVEGLLSAAEGAEKFKGGVDGLSEALKEAADEEQELNNQINALEESLQEVDGTTTKFESSLKKTSKTAESSATKFSFVFGAMQGLVGQFRSLMSIGSFVGQTFLSIASNIFQVGTAILSIPFKILGGLVDMAQGMGGGNEFAQAREKVRQQFGDLSKDIAKNVMQSEKNMHGMMASGLRAFRVFGNRAEQLTYFTEMFTAMGNVAHLFGDEIAKQPEIIGQYAKGLGLSHEQMKFVGLEAKIAGTTLEDKLNEMTVASMGMAEKFGISHKLISRDIGDMMQDTKHYTSLTTHEMSRASVYVRKLGLEIKEVAGILDKFDNFNDAAVATSNLSQAFGMTIDTMEMLKEASPDKRIDMLRKSMAAAGQDAATMSRQELALLAANTGLDEATAKLAFSTKNQGVSMKDLEKQQEKNKKKTMTQEEAMGKLANSIERLIKSGQSLRGGFFSMFAQGFTTGMQRAYPFRMMLRSLRRSLRVVYWAGRRLGRAFIESFPGVSKMITAFREFFNPGRFRSLMGKIVEQFKAFFNDLKDPTKAKDAVGNLLTNIKNIFLQFFGGGLGPAQMFLDGFKDFGKALSNILVGAIKFAWSGIQPILKKITDNLKLRSTRREKRKEIAATVSKDLSPKDREAEIERRLSAAVGPETGIFDGLFDGLEGAFTGAFSELASVFGEIISPLWDLFTDPSFIDEVKNTLFDFFSYAFDAAFKALYDSVIEPYGNTILMGVIAWFAGGALLKGLTTSLGTGVVQGIFTAIGNAFSTAPGATGAMKKTSEGIEAAMKPTEGAIKSSKGVNLKDAASLGLKLLAIAAALSLGGIMFAYAVVAMAQALSKSKTSTESLSSALAVLGTMVLLMVPIGAAAYLLSGIDWKKATAGLAVASGALLVLGLIGGLIVWIMSETKPEVIDAVGGLMLNMSVALLAMIPVVVAAGALGALLMGPYGGFVLVAIASGLAVLGVALLGVAAFSIQLIEQLSSMPNDSMLGEKTNAFVMILNSINGFVDTISKIFAAMRPTLGDLLSGRGMHDMMDQGVKFIETLIGDPNSKTGILGLIYTVKEVIDSFASEGGVQDISENAKAFTQLLNATTGLMNAMQPNAEMLKAASKTRDGLFVTTSQIDLSGISKLMTNMRQGLISVINTVSNLITSIDLKSIPDPESLNSVGNVLNAIGSILNAVRPDPAMLETFRTTVEGTFEDTKKLDLGKVTTFISAYMGAISTALPKLSGDIIDKILKSVQGVDVDKLKQLEGVSKLLGSLGELFKVIAPSLKKVTTESKDAANVGKSQFTHTEKKIEETGDIVGAIKGIAESMQPIMTNLSAAIAIIPNDKQFLAKLTSAQKLFSLLVEIPKLVTSLKEASSTGAITEKLTGVNLDPQKLMSAFTIITDFLGALSDTTGGDSPLQKLISKINTIGGQLELDKKTNMSKTAESVKSFLETLPAMVTALSSFAKKDDANKIPDKGTITGQISSLDNALEGMLGTGGIQKLDETLTKSSADVLSRVAKKIETSSNSIRKINDALTGGNLVFDKTQLDAIVTSYKGLMEWKMPGESLGITPDMKDKTTGKLNAEKLPIVEEVKNMVAIANQINSELSNLKTSKVSVKLKALGKTLGLSNEKLTIKNEGRVNVHLDLNVSMDAAEVATVLVKKTKYVAVGTNNNF